MRWTFGLISALGIFAATANAAVTADVLTPAPAGEAVTALTYDDVCCNGALDKLPPGKYEMTFIHPHTCCPVTVCFCIPCVPCECYEIECGKGLLCAYNIEFDYPGCKNDVLIRFKKNGEVVVK